MDASVVLEEYVAGLAYGLLSLILVAEGVYNHYRGRLISKLRSWVGELNIKLG